MKSNSNEQKSLISIALKMLVSEHWVDFIEPFTLYSKLLNRTFTPKKASKKFRVEQKMALRLTLSLYDIDPNFKLRSHLATFKRWLVSVF